MSNIQPLKWHGGKRYLAKWIVDQMPTHKVYLESHFGGGQVLFNKPCEGIIEYANDLDGELMNFWRVLQDSARFDTFNQWISNIPLSETEFNDSLLYLQLAKPTGIIDIARAVAFFVKMRQSRQGLGKSYATPTSRPRRGMNENASAWLTAVDGLSEAHERLRRVEVWNRSAEQAIARLNGPDLLVYADPPYVHSSRSSIDMYSHEMSERAHAILLATFQTRKVVALAREVFDRLKGNELYESFYAASNVPFQGKFLLSGYSSSLYDHFAFVNGWRCERYDIANNASSAATKERKTELLWRNY